MLNLTQQSKIKSFLVDKMMSESVKMVLRETFMLEKDGDVHSKASQMMAINLLEEGFKELEKQSRKIIYNEKERNNPGL